MNAERWQQIEAVLQDALDRPPLERASFLEQACAGDEELKEEATTLIAAYVEAGDFIEKPAIAQDAHVLISSTIWREIGPYRIIERLGAGGMSEVYLAEDTRLRRLVALKLLPSYFAADEARLRLFQSEARAASALNHPNILTIYEVGESEGVYFIATEFIDGSTIRELIKNHELTLEDIFDIIEQTASALSAAHAAGIVHRDIKPENIMRRSDCLLKILDFGIAKLIAPETSDTLTETTGIRIFTEAGMVMGTVNYMSPEQARALPVDERTDIWSLGVLLYEMLSGRLPFSGATRMDTMVAILDREPIPLSDVPKARLLQPIIDRCLRKEMSDRYRTVGELLSDLKTAKEQPNRPPARTSAMKYVMMSVAVLLAVIAGMLLYNQSTTTPPPAAAEAAPTPAKLYSQMSERERLDFVAAQEQRISSMISERPGKVNDDAVLAIKAYVDFYVARMKESPDVGAAYERAQPYVPLIASSFAARKVPIVIGIYLPVVESGYSDCVESPQGAKGLFQFMPGTAARYGVARQDMCDANKMAPAAAHLIADRMAELGEDSDSVTLVLLSYNHGEEWVRNTLRRLRGTENYERNVWALLANRESLNNISADETVGYVPRFFAAAIIGENPKTFGLTTPPLSTLAQPHLVRVSTETR